MINESYRDRQRRLMEDGIKASKRRQLYMKLHTLEEEWEFIDLEWYSLMGLKCLLMLIAVGASILFILRS